MRGGVLISVSILSLSFSVSLASICAWSYVTPYAVGLRGNAAVVHGGMIEFNTLPARVIVALKRRVPPSSGGNLVWRQPPPPPPAQRLPIEFMTPIWPAVVALGTAGGLCAGRARKSLHKPGACGVCGYDLRATPDRCPECGALTSTSV